MPLLPSRPTALRPAPARPSATPAVPRVGTTQHLDGIWITPMRIAGSQGANGVLPNLGDQFLIISLRIVNRTQFDYSVHTGDFQALDGNGELDPPLTKDFTRKGLREVVLIPQGHTIGTLIFEVPLHSRAVTLIYQHDTLDPSKRKEWQLNDSPSS